MGKKKAEYPHQHYRQLAYLIHELTCHERQDCNYGRDFHTSPPVPPSERHHCQGSVLAENLAAEIIRGERM